MPFSRSTFRSAFAALASVVLLAGLPLRGADDDRPPPEPVKDPVRERMRGLPQGFGGLSPVEAQQAAKLLAEGKALQAEGNDRAALGRYKRIGKKYPRSAAAPESFYQTARIHLKNGRRTKAFEAFDVVVRAYPDFGHFNELIAEEYRIAYDLIKGKRQKMFGLLPGFPNRDRGIQYFQRLVVNAPYSDYAPLALMNVANEFMRTRNTAMAVDTLDQLITNYPNSVITPDGYLRSAQVHEETVSGPYYDQGSTRDSIRFYEDFLILFPHDSSVGEAEEGLARMKDMLAKSRLKIADFYYFKRQRYQAARVFYNEAITIAPTSASAQLARERIAQLEVDEARAEARLAAQGEKAPGGFLGIFRRSQPKEPAGPGTVEPARPQEEQPPSPPSPES